MQTAADAYIACLIYAAKRVDDQLSDATTIALAIKDGCVGEREHWKEVWGAGVDPTLGRNQNETIDEGRLQNAVTAVLRERQMRRSISN